MKAKQLLRKLLTWSLRSIGVLILLILIFILIIWIYSPGKAELFYGAGQTNTALSEINTKEINGAKQRLVLRSHDTLNPVLLIVHGGPGGYQVPFLYEELGISVEDMFTVCYWDQRGSGPGFDKNIPDSTITLSQIADDGVKITNYLKERFAVERIFIEGQSWGTAVASYMVDSSPESYYAYIGIGQITNTLESEIRLYNYLIEEATRNQDSSVLKSLFEIGPPPYESNQKMVQAVDMTRYYLSLYQEGTLPITKFQFIKSLLLYKGMTLGEKFQIISGKASYSFSFLWPQAVKINLFDDIREWSVPIYIIQGENDHQTATELVKLYFDSITAPSKRYYEFKESKHAAHWEQPRKYLRILRTIKEQFKSQ